MTKGAQKLLRSYLAGAADAPTIPNTGLSALGLMLAQTELERGGYVEERDGQLFLTPKGATWTP